MPPENKIPRAKIGARFPVICFLRRYYPFQVGGFGNFRLSLPDASTPADFHMRFGDYYKKNLGNVNRFG